VLWHSAVKEGNVRVVTLVENTQPDGREDLVAEHGLSLYIECGDRRILFDTGATDAFARNAEKLGIDLREVDVLFVSHHHYDHGGGLARFLEINDKATVYLCKSKDEAYYFRAFGGILSKHIGLDQDLLHERAERFAFVDGSVEILPGVYVLAGIAHPYALPRGNRRLFVKRDKTYHRDDFEHELSLVIRENDALVAFTGCAHNGVLNIMAAVTDQFQDLPIRAVLGGFHLVDLPILNTMAGSKRQVAGLGEKLLAYPVERYYTGHCTGMKAYRVLKEVMAERLDYLPTGSDLLL
jgi:7,8-dihydropterin-6-yl-methyl-4-(beta-D-ribofuranosyl)aminobenzene 5'-phosphate synthase